MCGRTAITKSAGEIADACSYRGRNNEVQKPTWKGNGSKTYNGSYNKGPKSCSPILLQNRLQHSGTNEELSERIIMPMQWGMVPSWHKGDPKKFNFNMINCRCDTITEKKSFAKALEHGQRCVVLAEGFYEWHAENGNKQPYYIQLKDSITPHLQFNKEIENEEDGSCQTKKSGKQLLTMAGLFDKHVSEEQGELYTYTIITVDSSSSMMASSSNACNIGNTRECREMVRCGKRLRRKGVGIIKTYQLFGMVSCIRSCEQCAK
ncbi:abasic site processing protein HMCES-like [Clytia hemisphaerica]|uniref:abasic site processing protein HMCES-like n=1 Tax=Clytia hemisphaerica TaxID=252671 RepID=UPI0034D4DD4E